MTTRIPRSELRQILQANSTPEATVALLNKAEDKYSQRHGNAKRSYPYWKMCAICSTAFPCITKEQATRKKACSIICCGVLLRRPKKKKAMEDRKGKTVQCSVCGKSVWKPAAWLKRVKNPMCSYSCNSKERGKELVKHSSKGRAAWTESSRKSFRKKMSGAGNPAWKGGATYFRKHGNYKPIKYVRCPVDCIDMARKDGYVMEHRLIVAKAMGRLLLRHEVVHHEDHNPQNNTLSNLSLFASNKDHKLYEHHGFPKPLWRG